MSDQSRPDPLFDLVAYLVSCARLSLDEPVVLGSFRLIEGASRLISASEDIEGLEVDAFLAECRESIEREKLRAIEDHAGYRDWLTDFLGIVAAEATRRNLELPEPELPPDAAP